MYIFEEKPPSMGKVHIFKAKPPSVASRVLSKSVIGGDVLNTADRVDVAEACTQCGGLESMHRMCR
jgi:hypothetical protein